MPGFTQCVKCLIKNPGRELNVPEVTYRLHGLTEEATLIESVTLMNHSRVHLKHELKPQY